MTPLQLLASILTVAAIGIALGTIGLYIIYLMLSEAATAWRRLTRRTKPARRDRNT